MTEKDRLAALVKHYERILDAMQDMTFYAENADGTLRRWYPPQKRPDSGAGVEP